MNDFNGKGSFLLGQTARYKTGIRDSTRFGASDRSLTSGLVRKDKKRLAPILKSSYYLTGIDDDLRDAEADSALPRYHTSTSLPPAGLFDRRMLWTPF